jgi:hypothetical protein
MHFMSRKKNMKKSNDRHDKLLCIMMHGSLAFGKRYGIIMYNVELGRPSGRFLREIRGFQLPPYCLIALWQQGPILGSFAEETPCRPAFICNQEQVSL